MSQRRAPFLLSAFSTSSGLSPWVSEEGEHAQPRGCPWGDPVHARDGRGPSVGTTQSRWHQDQRSHAEASPTSLAGLRGDPGESPDPERDRDRRGQGRRPGPGHHGWRTPLARRPGGGMTNCRISFLSVPSILLKITACVREDRKEGREGSGLRLRTDLCAP